jgi:hypothetical protein
MEVEVVGSKPPVFALAITDATAFASDWEIHGSETADLGPRGRSGRLLFTDLGEAGSGPRLPGGKYLGVDGSLSWSCQPRA